MQRDPDGSVGHRKTRHRIGNRGAIDSNGLHDRALPGRQEFEVPADIGDKHIAFGSAVRQDFGKIMRTCKR